MADFSISQVGGPQGSAIQPQQPVVDDSMSIGLEGLSKALSGAGNMLTSFTETAVADRKERQKLELQAAQDQTVANFIGEQLKIADAVEMGDLPSAEARMRQRANLTKYIANNPSLAMDIGKAHTSLVEATKLGKSVYEGTEEEQQQLALEREVVSEGFVRPDAPPEQKREAVFAYTEFKRSMATLEAQQKRISLQSARVGLTTAGITQQSARLSLQEKQESQISRAALGSAANAFSVKLGNSLENIRQAHARGEIDDLQAQMMIDNEYRSVQEVATQIGSGAGSDFVNGMLRPMESMKESYKEYTSGTITLAGLNTRSETAKAMQVNNMLGDPQTLKLAALNGLYSNGGAALQTQMSNDVVRLLDVNTNPDTKPADMFPDFQEGKDSVRTYSKGLLETMRKLNQGVAERPELTKDQVDANVTNVLRSIEVYGGTVSSPADYNGVVELLADVELGKYVKKNGGMPDQAAAFKAGQTLEYEYANEVLPLIAKEFKNAQVVSSLEMSEWGRVEKKKVAKEMIEAKFLGSGVTFTVKPGFESQFTRKHAKKLNEGAGAALNRLIRATAHVQGTVDYKSVYDTMFSNLFNEREEAEDVTGE